MILQSSSASPCFEFSRSYASRGLFCPCRREDNSIPFSLSSRKRRKLRIVVSSPRSTRLRFLVRAISSDSGTVEFANSARGGAKSLVVARFSDDFASEEWSQESPVNGSSNRVDRKNFAEYREDLIVDKLRTQLGVIHPLPSPSINRNAAGLFAFFFFVGVVFDNLWTFCKRLSRRARDEGQRGGPWPLVPTSFSLFLEKDLLRKESVEWVNMVLEKLWKVYRGGIENWIIGLMQPVIDDLKKPDYVQRVEIKQFSLGDEPLSVRSVERRTSRRVNDLQYQIGIRYTGGARMLLMLSLKVGGISLKVPVSVRNFDIDGELWVKLRLIPSEPWVGAVSWAFVSLPKIKFELSLFRLLNLMGIPVLSMFLTKLLTEDLPRLFVRPKKTVLDFQEGKAVGPVADDFKTGEVHERSNDYVGELSVTLVDAKGLPYVFYGKTDPYVILKLGDQVIRSKKNSQTTVFGPPSEPIWNQDFHLLVENPRTQKLNIEVNDCLGFTDLAIGTGEVDLGSLQDTVPTDRVVPLRGGWTLFRTRLTGQVLLRLTYKAYVEDEEDHMTKVTSVDADARNTRFLVSDEQPDGLARNDGGFSNKTDEESFMNVLSALIVSEEFQGIVSSEAGYSRVTEVNSMTPKESSRSKLKDSESAAEIPEPDSDDGVGIEDSNLTSFSTDPEKASKSDGGSAMLWFSVITGLSLLIALSMHFSSFFNP